MAAKCLSREAFEAVGGARYYHWIWILMKYRIKAQRAVWGMLSPVAAIAMYALPLCPTTTANLNDTAEVLRYESL